MTGEEQENYMLRGNPEVCNKRIAGMMKMEYRIVSKTSYSRLRQKDKSNKIRTTRW
ncbi:MAG: hypothetical protein ACJA1E_000102 [Paracoccaceae bacterium]|jgi:hypothetical protein